MQQQFPRTAIGDLSVSRMIVGTNNICGGSHRTMARDKHIQEIFRAREAVADIVCAYLEYGVDTVIGRLADTPHIVEGIQLAEERSGKKVHRIELTVFDTSDTPAGREDAKRVIGKCAAQGCEVCLPLHTCVEQLLDKQSQTIPRIGDYLYMIRESGMLPGLSAHMPEVIQYADANEYDVETYIQIYNAIGFLMQIEIETVQRIIWNAKKPVLTIKSMAAGHLNPFVGLSFSWNTIRPQDMIAVGCMTPLEAREVIEISYATFEHRLPNVEGRLHQY